MAHYVLERPLPPLAIPTTLHASLMARLDRLAPVREVAQIGAVAGREFHYELLNAVAGLPKEKLRRGARPAGAVGIDFPPWRDSTRGLYLQAHAGAGRRICGPPEKPARASARRHCECARAAIPGHRANPARNSGAPSHGSGTARKGGRILAAGRQERGATLGQSRGHRTRAARHRGDGPLAGRRGQGQVRARFSAGLGAVPDRHARAGRRARPWRPSPVRASCASGSESRRSIFR